MEEIKNSLNELSTRLNKILTQIDRNVFQREIRELETKTLKEGFWNAPIEAKKVTKQLADKQKELNSLENLESRVKNALDFADEPSMEQDLRQEVEAVENELSDLELKLFLSFPHAESE